MADIRYAGAGESRRVQQVVSGHTRAARRDATRRAIVDAAYQCLVTAGYQSVRTRAVAEMAGVAQGTVTYHFPTRAHLLEAASVSVLDRADVTNRLGAIGQPDAPIDLGHLTGLWDLFTTKEALAGLQLWLDSWREPSLIPTVKLLDRLVYTAVADAFGIDLRTATPEAVAFLECLLSSARGMLVSIPVHGLSTMDRRWRAVAGTLLLPMAQNAGLRAPSRAPALSNS
ncbi:MAG: hypothetical protein DI630_15505 [Gordonia sp. (in: high G+C Gram-positive bacteria)]|nr:MAG: hypothetical protein DI630_15505 [Gordonia sp. (in: high G+C Gram-positive bacteria)]